MKLYSILIILVSIILLNLFFKLPQITSNQIQSNNLQKNCKNTNLDYQSLQFISKNTYMNRTLQLINFTEINGSYHKQNDLLYKINNTKVNLFYDDSSQNASFGQNQIILIQGGKLQTKLNFQWFLYDANTNQMLKRGTAMAQGISRDVNFAFQIYRPKNATLQKISWTGFDLYSIMNITFPTLSMTKIDCRANNTICNITDVQMLNLNNLLSNGGSNITTIKKNLQTELFKKIPNQLSQVICCIHSPTYSFFRYYWKTYTSPEDQPPFEIYVDRNPITLMIDKNGSKPGIYARYQTIVSLEDECAPQSPNNIFDTKTFGGGQQILSLTIFQNLLKHGIQKNQLDTILNAKYWSTRDFKFYVSDLNGIVSNLQKFSPLDILNGACQASEEGLKIQQGSLNNTLNVLINSNCYIAVNETKLLTFDVQLDLEVYVKFHQYTLDVWLRNHKQLVSYYINPDHRVLYTDQANYIITTCIQRLFEDRLYGSGWEFYLGQKNPTLFINETSLLIYDKSLK